MSRFRLVHPRNLVLVLLAVLVSAGAAVAAPPATEGGKKAARPHYEKGAAEYNLGHFAESIAEFEKAYEMDPAPILLFNIAQAHRQNGSNERAAFFYRRYLEQAPSAANRPEVEKRIKDLEEMMKQQNDVKRRPPTEVTDQEVRSDPTRAGASTSPPPVVSPSIINGSGASAASSSGTAAPVPAAAAQPEATVAAGGGGAASELGRRIRVRASGGLALPRFGGLDGSQPAQFALRVGGEYTFDIGGPGYLDVGLGLSFLPFSYSRIDTQASVGSTFWGVMANGVYRYRLTRELELAGEVGVGVVWWTGVGEESPFVKPEAGSTTVPGTSGALAMPSVSLGVAAIYRLPYRIFVYGQPGFLFSKTATDGLTISSVSRFDFAIGIGYAL